MVERLAPGFAAMAANEIEIDKEMKEHDEKRRKKK